MSESAFRAAIHLQRSQSLSAQDVYEGRGEEDGDGMGRVEGLARSGRKGGAGRGSETLSL